MSVITVKKVTSLEGLAEVEAEVKHIAFEGRVLDRADIGDVSLTQAVTIMDLDDLDEVSYEVVGDTLEIKHTQVGTKGL